VCRGQIGDLALQPGAMAAPIGDAVQGDPDLAIDVGDFGLLEQYGSLATGAVILRLAHAVDLIGRPRRGDRVRLTGNRLADTGFLERDLALHLFEYVSQAIMFDPRSG
jgi:hypothetical protein